MNHGVTKGNTPNGAVEKVKQLGRCVERRTLLIGKHEKVNGNQLPDRYWNDD
jgi:hypothetical protein